MERTTFFGLALVLIVVQFTGLSHEQYVTYYGPSRQQNFFPVSDIGGPINIELSNVNFGLQSGEPDAVDKRQWYSFVENLDLNNMALEYIFGLVKSVIEGNASKESKNYFNILYVLESLADKTICNNSSAHYNVLYYGTVALALIEDKIQAEKVASEFFERLQRAQSTVNRIKSLIENTNSTHGCVILPKSECNRIIYNFVLQSDRDVLMAEAQTLLKLADLAHLYFNKYHIEFYEAAKNDNVFWHLMKNKNELRPLVQAIVSARLLSNTDVPDC